MYWLLTVALLLTGPIDTARAGREPVQGAQIIDRLAAVAAGQPITLSDVNAALEFHLVNVPPDAPNRTQAALQKLIDRSLMLIEVDRFQPPEPEPVEITIRVDALRKQAGSPLAFSRELDLVGMTLDQLRRFIRDDLRITTYLNQRFGDTPQRAPAVAAWVSELRRRNEVTVLYPSSSR